MVTTIQLNEDVKNALDRMKENKESYEEVIVKMMRAAENQKRHNKHLLKEGYAEMANELSSITKEWSSIDKDWD